MKTLNRTIIAFVALSLLAAGFTSANNVSDEGARNALEMQAREAEIEARVAQKQTEAVQKQMLMEQKEMEIAQRQAKVRAVRAQAQLSGPAAPEAPAPPSTPSPAPVKAPTPPAPSALPTSVSVPAVNDDIFALTQGLSYGSRSAGADSVLVIPSGKIETEEIININEDMSVMSRIFQKNLGQARISTARSSLFTSRTEVILPLLRGGRGQIQSMYLQGYGALFLMKVDFPLSPSSNAQEQEKETEKEQEGDPVWREMRREMYEPEKVDRRRRNDQPEEKYDPEKVKNLKTTLIKALKHAANIRRLKPDESVILTVTGSGQATGKTITAVTRAGENQIIVSERVDDGNTRTRIVQGTSLDDIGLSSPSILVIRTKKSDIDEFAKGNLGFEQFRQRVQLLTYPLLGGAYGHGDPFDLYRRSRSVGSSNVR